MYFFSSYSLKAQVINTLSTESSTESILTYEICFGGFSAHFQSSGRWKAVCGAAFQALTDRSVIMFYKTTSQLKTIISTHKYSILEHHLL